MNWSAIRYKNFAAHAHHYDKELFMIFALEFLKASKTFINYKWFRN